MKISTVIVLLLIVCTFPVYAVTPINEAVIKDAQTYGTAHNQMDVAEFLAPWTAYEEKAAKITDSAEKAYLYTPYLLIAVDAREKSQAKKPVKVGDSEKILSDYAGYLSFSVTLYGDTPQFADKISAVIKQGNKDIFARDLNSAVAERISAAGNGNKPLYMTRCYLYFLERDIDQNKPVMLRVITGEKQNHSFYFDLAKIK